MGVLDLIEKFGEAEDNLSSREIISPVHGNRKIATRLAGIVYQLTIPRVDNGWHKFTPIDYESARRIGEADPVEIDQYLRHLPRVRMVLVQRTGSDYLAIPLKQSKVVEDLYPVLLVDNAPMDFDTVIARYDGVRLWYHDLDPRNDPQKGEYLRESFQNSVKATDVRFSGLTFEEKSAYALRAQIEEQAREKTNEERVKEAVEHGGGEMLRLIEREDHFSVTYTVDGRQYTTRVTKDDSMAVVCAGFCLSGEDEKFDLKSLIPVLKEGHRDRHYFEVWNADDPNFYDPHRPGYNRDDEDEDDW